MSGPVCGTCDRLESQCECDDLSTPPAFDGFLNNAPEVKSATACHTCDGKRWIEFCDPENGPSGPEPCPDCFDPDAEYNRQLVTGAAIVVRFQLTAEEILAIGDDGQRHLDKIVHAAIEILREAATTHVDATIDERLTPIPTISVERVED